MNKYENQEAFILAAKRVKARISRAKELKVDELDSKGLLKLVENLSTAKAIQDNKTVAEVQAGQEYYIQTLIDALACPVDDLLKVEYDHATMELGTTQEILEGLEALQAA